MATVFTIFLSFFFCIRRIKQIQARKYLWWAAYADKMQRKLKWSREQVGGWGVGRGGGGFGANWVTNSGPARCLHMTSNRHGQLLDHGALGVDTRSWRLDQSFAFPYRHISVSFHPLSLCVAVKSNPGPAAVCSWGLAYLGQFICFGFFLSNVRPWKPV